MKIHLRYILTVLLLTGLLESNYWAQAQEMPGQESMAITTIYQDFEQVFFQLRKEQSGQGLTHGGLFYKLGTIRPGMAAIVKE